MSKIFEAAMKAYDEHGRHSEGIGAVIAAVQPLIEDETTRGIVAALREQARWHAEVGCDDWARDVLNHAADAIEKGEVRK